MKHPRDGRSDDGGSADVPLGDESLGELSLGDGTSADGVSGDAAFDHRALGDVTSDFAPNLASDAGDAGEPWLAPVLRWRVARAAAEAPPPPSAAALLARARPWWEAWPGRWQTLVERLGRVQLAYGQTAPAPGGRASGGRAPGDAGHPVPVLVTPADVGGDAVEACARVLYLSVRDGRLRLRLLLQGVAPLGADFEASFVAEPAGDAGPLLVARAERAGAGEYRLDVPLPPSLAESWSALRVTDRLPFRLILRPLAGDAGGVR